MRKIRFTDEQIVAMLQEHEGGAPTGELIRRHGIVQVIWPFARRADQRTPSDLQRPIPVHASSPRSGRLMNHTRVCK